MVAHHGRPPDLLAENTFGEYGPELQRCLVGEPLLPGDPYLDELVDLLRSTVWVELKAPDIVAGPVGREVAAVMVRPGQRVRVWGAWRVVVDVRSEQCDGGDPAVVLGLDEGPALRVQATEPLAVRQCEDV